MNEVVDGRIRLCRLCCKACYGPRCLSTLVALAQAFVRFSLVFSIFYTKFNISFIHVDNVITIKYLDNC